ncbi:MAG: NUDIX domain-containing protein [Peptostreptococcus sp.]|uniref:NUDIX domain-containing protein n=1 Tax=Peptostreptococcus sp. TaxID=1262 RepID=UPI002FC80644
MLTTVCYLERGNERLMLHRTKKEDDLNKGKWLGVGGKLEKDETPLQCVKREIKEETGYTANRCDIKGLVVFNYNDNASEFMYLYTCNDFDGNIIECNEGDLKWIKKEEIKDLKLWEGDKIFIDLIENDSPFFYLTLNYENDQLISHTLEFEEENFVRFEVFVPEDYVQVIVDELGKYKLIDQGYYGSAYSTINVLGHWKSLDGANPFDGEVGKETVARESLMKFRVKKDFKELAFYLVKKAHPYEVPVINVF